MLKLKIAAITILIVSQSIYSQVNIQISVKQSYSKQAKLFLYQQSGTILVDSSLQLSQGLFTFNLPINCKQGLYKFALGKNISLDFVVGSEPIIAIETIIFAAEDSAKSIISRENEIYFHFKRLKKRFNQQVWFLNSLVDYYSDTSIFRKQLLKEVNNVQTELNYEFKNLAQEYPNSFTSNLILLELKPVVPINLATVERKKILKKNWWIETNLTDKRLANSPVLDSKIWEYIDLYFDSSLDKEQQDSSFVAGIKALMNLNADLSVKSFIRDILLKNYLETDYCAVTKYLYETSFDGLPPITLTSEERNSYEIQGKNSVGTKARDFSVTLTDGSHQNLSKIKATYKLVAFWSMWCPHCTEMLPELYKTYLNYKLKGFEVVAVCIDDEIEGWKKFIHEKKYNWVNTFEPDNGESKILKEYNVDGTPKLFLVNKNMEIISRPVNVKHVEAKLKEIIH